ncbi:MAG TPA: GNAT family N-acetyltransferase [Solirubrobacteraceae bacterium]|jgi:GNAT superfamily N-acetyltransferase
MLIVRDAKAGDATEVAALHVRAWQAAYRGLLAEQYLDTPRPEDRAARYAFGSSDTDVPQTILAIEDGEICGFASTGRCRDLDVPAAGELYALYVDPPRWGTGVGRFLIAQAYTRLRDLGAWQAVLWVLSANERAERF